MNVYDILKSITYIKNEDLVNDIEFEKIYSQYSVNAFLSAHPSTVHLAMYASNAKLTNKQHYLFLLYATDKEYIFFRREYIKSKNPRISNEIKSISDYYNINEQHATDIHTMLKRNQIDMIYEIYNTKDIVHGKKISKS